MAIQYKQQWKIRSESNPEKQYTVSLTQDDMYICHCWPFLRNRTNHCKHIHAVLNGEVDQVENEPQLVICNIRQVEKENGEIKVPLIPIGDVHFLATLIFDALGCGASWKTLKEHYRLPKGWTRPGVCSYIADHGRKIWGPWQEGKGYIGFEIKEVQNG